MNIVTILEFLKDWGFHILGFAITVWICAKIYHGIKMEAYRKKARSRQTNIQQASSQQASSQQANRRQASRREPRTVPETQFHAPPNSSFSPPRTPADPANNNERNRIGYQGNETGSMIYYARDACGLKDKEYRFNFKKVNGVWRAYIIKMPSYGKRETWGHITHRHFDGDKPYICWDKSLKELKDIQTVARAWSDATQKYIAYGTRF